MLLLPRFDYNVVLIGLVRHEISRDAIHNLIDSLNLTYSSPRPISSLEIPAPICYAHRIVPLLFFEIEQLKTIRQTYPEKWQNRTFDDQKIN